MPASGTARDRVETNEYGVRCVIGYRKVRTDGSVSIGGKRFRSDRLKPHAGKVVHLSPHNVYGDYSADVVGEGYDHIELEEV